MLIGFPPIFVEDTKIIYSYNFVAPLKKLLDYLNVPKNAMKYAKI